MIRDTGVGPGVVLNPATPIDVLHDILPQLDFVLLMSVNPGFSGQSFVPYVLDKARRLRSEIERRGLDVQIEIDGGVGLGNAREVAAAGIDVAVMGSAVFGTPDPVATLQQVHELLTAGDAP